MAAVPFWNTKLNDPTKFSGKNISRTREVATVEAQTLLSKTRKENAI